MEEKILEILNTLNQKFDQVKEELRQELRQEFKQENEKLAQRMEQKMDQKMDDLSSEVKQEFAQVEKKLNHLSEEVNYIIDKQVVFKDEYGTKIDAMFDYVQ